MISTLTAVNTVTARQNFIRLTAKTFLWEPWLTLRAMKGEWWGGCDSIEGRRQRRRRMLSEPSQLHPTCRPRLLISTISHHPGIIKDCPIPAPSLSHHLLSKYNKYLQIINCFFNGDSISPPLYTLPPGPGGRPDQASISIFLSSPSKVYYRLCCTFVSRLFRFELFE